MSFAALERERDTEIKRRCRLLGLSETEWSKIGEDNCTVTPSIWMYRFKDTEDLNLVLHARERGVVITCKRRSSFDGNSRFDLLAKLAKLDGR
ncbi:hypothetical protein [Acidiphilium angustum]|uniref:hypothetical protein n=1 Tax=Acidiphilium angustum TaxID=523 RepID=UPI000493EC32|nr:hypothetical protein [Acidiphilium angustum]